MTRSLLVTGASGFLGARVLARLAPRWAITAIGLSRPIEQAGVQTVKVDLTDGPAVARALGDWTWDAVVHLAGPVPHAYPDWHEGAALVGAHARIAANLLCTLPKGFTGRLVHTSSMTVYGMPEAVRVTEDHPRRPMHPYGLGKAIGEDVLLSGPPLDRWVLRFGGLFSADRRGGALWHFMKAAREGRALRVAAATPTPWNILHVEDAVTAIERALDATARDPGPLNVSYGEPIEIGDIARRVAARTSVPVEIDGPAAHPPFELTIDKLRSLVDFPPLVDGGGGERVTLDRRLEELWTAWALPAPTPPGEARA